MYYFRISYKLKDNKTDEEFIVLIYCKTENDKLNRSDLPGAIKDSIYSIGHIQELVLHSIDQVSEEEYEKQNSQIN